MQIPAEKADDTFLEEVVRRLASKEATLTREEVLLLLAHIRHLDERLEEVAVDRDTYRDTLDQLMSTAN